MKYLVIIAICAVVVFILAKVIAAPAKVIKQVIINIVLGTFMLYLINYVGSYFNYSLGFNTVNAVIIGLLGVPGVIALVVLKYLGI